MRSPKGSLHLVQITWNDATVRPGWHHWDEGENKLTPKQCHTVGWVVDDEPSYVTVTQSICDIAFGNLTTIPKKWILKRVRIK